MSKELQWSKEYIEKLVGDQLWENEVIESVEVYDNGYGKEYIAMYSNQDVVYLFDYYTHDFLYSREA